MRTLFRLTLVLSALLLFLVQPLMGRVLLPKVGGSAATWTVCMLFFQLALLAGYAYAHLTSVWLRRASAVRLHVVLLAIAGGITFAIRPADSVPPSSAVDLGAIVWLFGYLLTTCGAPFTLVAAHAPLLQRWFSQTSDPDARDPYFLYAASNIGSFTALLSYPFLVEPILTLGEQQRLWQIGYWALTALIAVCGAVAVRHATTAAAATPDDGGAGVPLTFTDRATWVLLSAVPSSLVLGLTTYISTELAPVPLFWLVPLALYLATFVIAFAKRATRRSLWPSRLLPIAALPVAMSALQLPPRALWLAVPCHLAFLGLAALVCHSRLADMRPAPSRLTEFYLWISVGGAIGGLWNGLVAPLVFNAVYEYPIAIALACLLRPRAAAVPAEPRDRRRSWLPAAVAAAIFAVIVSTAHLVDVLGVEWRSSSFMAVVFGPTLVALMLLWPSPRLFGGGIAALIAATIVITDIPGEVRLERRTFYGRLRVLDEPSGIRQLVHGSTMHGAQVLDPARAAEPTSYHYPNGPIATALLAANESGGGAPAAVVGLGAGSLIAYARPEQQWDFYEIDPGVIAIATNPSFFTFLSSSRAAWRVIPGDGRLSLARAPDGTYGVIIMDAFSSDSVPVHLLTLDALALYMRKLRPDGILVCHISNRYMELEPVLSSAAADLGLAALIRNDLSLTKADESAGRLPTSVVAMSRTLEALAHLVDDGRWGPLTPGSRWTRWSDDYANPLAAIRWR